jgi:hypothetical protein
LLTVRLLICADIALKKRKGILSKGVNERHVCIIGLTPPQAEHKNIFPNKMENFER